MSDEQLLRQTFVSLQVNDDFSEAIVQMGDGSRLCFCHRVGERWAKAVSAAETEKHRGLADQVLERITQFRLNAKHLDVQFQDGSRWEARFGSEGNRLRSAAGR
jgi:hypothetical protein